MGACASGGGPFKEGYNVVSGIDKYLPVDVYIPGCPPTPQALLNGLIMLQKKIDGESEIRSDAPLVRRRGRTRHPDPGARPRPDRPPDRRTRRRADRPGARREARGRALPKPRPDPRPPARGRGRRRRRGQAGRRRRRQADEQGRHDPGQGPRRGRPRRRRSEARRPRRQGRQEGRSGPRPGPAWSGSATTGLKELADRLNTEFGAGTATIVQAGLLDPGREAGATSACYLRDRNPIRYDYLASLQSVHYEDCIEVNYQLDSTTDPGKLIELRVRAAEARRARARCPRSTTSAAGPISRSARSTT